MSRKTTRRILQLYCLVAMLGFSACNGTSNNVSHYTAEDTMAAKPPMASSGGIASTGRGEELFRQRCSACHGINGNARKNNAEDLTLTRLDSVGIATAIRNGRPTMPIFSSDILPDSDVAQIVIYVRSIRK